MKNGWQTKKLGDVCVFDKVQGIHCGIPYVGLENIESHTARFIGSSEPQPVKSSTFRFSDEHVLYGRLRPYLNKALAPDFDGHCSTEIFPLKPCPKLSREYLLYWLLADETCDRINATCTGARMPRAQMDEVLGFEFPLPPLAEQQRIVGLLDEAFAGIATAKANAEKNLQNARALFESHLQSVFAQRGKGWTVKRISEISKHSLGKMLDKAKNKGEPQPYLRNINVRWFTFDLSDLLQMPFLPTESEKYTAIRGDVLICEGGYPGRAAIWNEDYPIYFQKALHRVRFHEPEHNKWFVYYLYAQDASGELKKHFNGTGIQHFTGEVLARFEIPIPPLPELQRTVKTFDELSEETQRLASLYEQKLAALEALKKSLLHQAFTGELIKEPAPQAARTASLELFPSISSFQNITPNNLHAGILAIGYQAYEQAGRQWRFQHVVAEKFSHMTEALVGIDLGRKPMQDHNGPNDFPHLLKVEHRARMANYFTFQDGPKGKIFVKGRGFESLVAKTRAALGEFNQKLDELIKLMLPMDMRQAEIFATTYAAWNNLLIEKQTPTNEQIVLAARENWHEDKLKIPREKFFIAIEWIRKKNICPQGKGKWVLPRAA